MEDNIEVIIGMSTYPNKVRQMLMRRSAPHPAMANTAIGGPVDLFGLVLTVNIRSCRRHPAGSVSGDVWGIVQKMVTMTKKIAEATPIFLMDGRECDT